MHHVFFHMWNYFPFMPIIMFIFVIIMLCIVIKLVRNGGFNSNNLSRGNDSSTSILNERFAKGEITKEELLEMKNAILKN